MLFINVAPLVGYTSWNPTYPLLQRQIKSNSLDIETFTSLEQAIDIWTEQRGTEKKIPLTVLMAKLFWQKNHLYCLTIPPEWLSLKILMPAKDKKEEQKIPEERVS